MVVEPLATALAAAGFVAESVVDTVVAENNTASQMFAIAELIVVAVPVETVAVVVGIVVETVVGTETVDTVAVVADIVSQKSAIVELAVVEVAGTASVESLVVVAWRIAFRNWGRRTNRSAPRYILGRSIPSSNPSDKDNCCTVS